MNPFADWGIVPATAPLRRAHSDKSGAIIHVQRFGQFGFPMALMPTWVRHLTQGQGACAPGGLVGTVGEIR